MLLIFFIILEWDGSDNSPAPHAMVVLITHRILQASNKKGCGISILSLYISAARHEGRTAGYTCIKCTGITSTASRIYQCIYQRTYQCAAITAAG